MILRLLHLADPNRDWDLWGPLVICLSLAIVLSIDVSLWHSSEGVPLADEAVTTRTVHAGLFDGHLARHCRFGSVDHQFETLRGQSVS